MELKILYTKIFFKWYNNIGNKFNIYDAYNNIFAIFLGILKGFGLDNKLIAYLKSYLSQNEVILTYILDVANKLIESSKSSVLTGMGAILLVITVIKNAWYVRKNF